MHIRLIDNGREMKGTALDIVLKLKNGQFGGDDLTLDEFIEKMCERTRRWHKVDLAVTGATGDERADSLIAALVAHKLAEYVDTNNEKEDK